MASSPPPPPPASLRASIYSPKAVLLQGDTYPHREALKEMGGKWNESLRGWVFSRRSRSGQVDAWLRRMGHPGLPPEALAGGVAEMDAAGGQGPAAAGPLRPQRRRRRVVTMEEEEEEEEESGGKGKAKGKGKGGVKQPARKKRVRRQRGSSSEEEEESDDSGSGGSFEGESDSEEEVWEAVTRAERRAEEGGAGKMRKGKGKGPAAAVARRRGGGVRVGGAAAARARQQKREEGKASAATTGAPMLALPSELFYGQLVPCLGQQELARLHATCKTLALWLDDPRAWSALPFLDLSYRTLAIRRTRSGRVSVQPQDVTILDVMRVVGQDRFRLLQGVDLSGMELGSQRGAGGGAPLVNYVLERCPRLKRLRLQGPGDSSFGWSSGTVESSLHSASEGIREGITELALEVEHVHALHSLLGRLPNLTHLTLGGVDSRDLSPGQWGRVLSLAIGGKLEEEEGMLAPEGMGAARLHTLVLQGQTQLDDSVCRRLHRRFPHLRRLRIDTWVDHTSRIYAWMTFHEFHYHYDETSASPLSDVKPEADDFPFNLSRDPERPHWVWGRVERWDGEERERERITKGW